MVFFCGPTANKFLFSNESKLVATWWPSTFSKLFHSNSSVTSTPTGLKTKSVRDVVSAFLKPDVLQNYVPTMDSIAREHVEKGWEPNGGELVVLEAVKMYTLELACQLLVGIKDHEHWAGFADRFASVLAGIVSVPIDFPDPTCRGYVRDHVSLLPWRTYRDPVSPRPNHFAALPRPYHLATLSVRSLAATLLVQGPVSSRPSRSPV
ncbi:hypothetical protein RHSIM_Rhsim11G0032900 [Rhododendron simsii]|uniref:Uncharacterized protein n=1 Tax=Rhododendron simsii TaxID=118357 RepID=A0A834GB40_RHOSS|nr:hypothetical protein RHSIM_Rhsim11G0032900 [Rhododendron simsii]